MTEATPPPTFTERGGRWVAGQFILMAAVLALGVVFPGSARHPASLLFGVALGGCGAFIGIAGVRALGANRTAFPRPKAQAALVEHGIYSRIRHPLYTSVMLLALGWAAGWQSWPALLAALTLIAWLVAKARREERWLREKFPAYTDYARRVPPFLPRWPGGRRRL
jgi:protein-S-isoprenylcysteine O-methyltransferase Ste14